MQLIANIWVSYLVLEIDAPTKGLEPMYALHQVLQKTLYEPDGAICLSELEHTIWYIGGPAGYSPPCHALRFAGASWQKGRASFTGGDVALNAADLHGRGIGSALLSMNARWLKQWPDSPIDSIKLSSADVRFPENRARRNRLYQRFGFRWSDVDPSEGHSYPLMISELVIPPPIRKPEFRARALASIQSEWRAEVLGRGQLELAGEYAASFSPELKENGDTVAKNLRDLHRLRRSLDKEISGSPDAALNSDLGNPALALWARSYPR